jgi:dynein heavy chain
MAETTRVRYFMYLLMEKRRPVMLVGNAGTGKTVLAGDMFASLDPDEIMVANVPFNYHNFSHVAERPGKTIGEESWP